MNCSIGHIFLLLCWSTIRKSSANPLRVSTRHFAPNMYQNSSENFYSGMEFQLLQRIAKILNATLYFETTSNQSDICYNVTMNVTDICIGGIFPMEDIVKYSLMSVTYESDDLTWCLPKSKMMPKFLSFMLVMTPGAWFAVIFGFGYSCGLLLYLLIQFDLKYERRNDCDWHRTTWLVILPAVIGVSPNFKPVKVRTVRIFFVFVLIIAFFFFQLFFYQLYDFLYKQIPCHQVSSLNEIMDEDFHFVGSLEAFTILNRSKMDHLVIAGSRQNILNSPMYSSAKVFCFEGLENIASYPVALYMRKDFHYKEEVNAIVEALSDAGFFVEWKRHSQFKRKKEISLTIPFPLPISHIAVAFIFLIGCGSLLSTLTFIAENIIWWKMKQRCKLKFWIYLEQFFDGKRHYVKNLAERLQQQNKHSENENNFPYLE